MNRPSRAERRHEIEIKLKVADPKALKRRLRELGFVAKRREYENNYLFDFPDRKLMKARCMLRLRFIGEESILTFKGASLESPGYKVRCEIETRVEDGRKLREILESLGMAEVFRYEKYRTNFVSTAPEHRGSHSIEYDETPIGTYLELEGRTPWIDRVAHRLGYTRDDYITASYGSLYRRYCEERGIQPGNMVFRGRKMESSR